MSITDKRFPYSIHEDGEEEIVYFYYCDGHIWSIMDTFTRVLSSNEKTIRDLFEEIWNKNIIKKEDSYRIEKEDTEREYFTSELALCAGYTLERTNMSQFNRRMMSYHIMYKSLEINDSTKRNSIEKENGIEVESLEEYFRIIAQLNNDKKSTSSRLFFRGQEVDYWSIEPSIYRGNMLSVESTLMLESLRNNPHEFIDLSGGLDVFQKYQHYGMCTRLLDVTDNPLVALYYACVTHGREWYINDNNVPKSKEPDGIIFFREEQAPLQPYDDKVKIIIELAKYNLSEDNSLIGVLNYLQKNNVIDGENYKYWKTEEGIDSFISIIQETYLVLPVLNNERLKRQSGAFLLPGKFNVRIDNKKEVRAVIEKAVGTLRDEFEETFIYVSGDNKKKILEELDSCGINEAKLFPELEYQLKHIKNTHFNKLQSVSSFEKYSPITERTDKNGIDKYQEHNVSIDTINEIVSKYLSDKKLVEDVVSIIDNNQKVISWRIKDSQISKLKINIARELKKSGFVEPKQTAESIVKDVLQEK